MAGSGWGGACCTPPCTSQPRPWHLGTTRLKCVGEEEEEVGVAG